MDRVSSKTNDVYVELASLQAAINVVERLESNLGKGRPARLGNRPVDVSVSSPAKLMHDLFPVARGIMWNGFRPEFKAYDPQWSFENFQTFVSAEEMVMLVKHVENPTRVSKLPTYLANVPWWLHRYRAADMRLMCVPVAFLQGLARAPLRVHDQHTQEDAMVHD